MHAQAAFSALLCLHGHVLNPSRDMCTSSPLSGAMGHMVAGPVAHVMCHMAWVTWVLWARGVRRARGVLGFARARRARRDSSGFVDVRGVRVRGGPCGQELVRAWVNWPGGCMNMRGDGEAPQGLRSARRELPPARHVQHNRLDVQRCALAGAQQSWCSGYRRLVLVGAFA
jgi:hypothetical protein